MQQVTIYVTSEMMGNVTKREGKLVSHGKRKYAQYDAAPYVNYIPKGRRNPVQLIKASHPYIIILAGHNHPEPDELFQVVRQDKEVKISKSKYMSFDEHYKTDFDAKINPYIEHNKGVLIADYRQKETI